MQIGLLERLNENRGKMSKGHKKIADYICSDYDKAAFMTAAKLGSAVGVSESTVVRFAVEIGYDGYPELQKAMKEYAGNKLTAVQRMDAVNDRYSGEDVLNRVMNFDIEQIRRTLEETDREEFYRTVDVLCGAKMIYVIGARSASVLARFLVFYFNVMVDNVKIIHTTSTSDMFEQLININKDDILIGISFPRYSEHTEKAFAFAKENGATVIAITDSMASPIAVNADHVLLARSDMASFADSLTAPLSLINALITAVSIRRKDYVSANYERLERILEKYDPPEDK